MKTFFTTFILTVLFLASTFTASFSQINWTKVTLNNPVLDPGPSGAWDAEFVGSPSVLFDGNTYHMWYWGGTDYNLRGIGYATSQNGITWTKYDDSTTTSSPYAESDPVLNPGQLGEWDDASVATPSVLLLDTTYHLWYAGSQDPTLYGLISIGHAISTNGSNWEKDTLNNPVLSPGSPGSWDDVLVFGPCVLFDGSIYHMWYNAWNGSQNELMRIGHATKPHPDSIWTKDTNKPVLSYEVGEWDYPRVDAPWVIYDGNTYHMWYSGGDIFAWRIGHAASPDGSVWTKYPEDPVLNWGSAGSWDDGLVGFCSVILEDSTYKMWYTGGNAVWDGHIGYATAPDSVTGIYDEISSKFPRNFVLMQNYPNPFNPSTTISYTITRSGFVSLIVYDVLGVKVQTLVNENQRAGDHSILFDANQLSSGIYFYTLQAGNGFAETKKMLLMR
jgi:hypothetical protein